MGSTKKHDGNNWKKFGSTNAIDIKITDFSGNFESDNVEGALREASSKISDIDSSVQGQKAAIQKQSEDLAVQKAITDSQTKALQQYAERIQSNMNMLAQHEEDIQYLKEHGGGGGGSNIAPTITSKFEDGTIVEKGSDVLIPIFFSSPNLGDGTAYIVINGIEVDSVSVKAGNNNVNIGQLTELNNEVSIYVKDRVGMLSNQLTWKIICGGMELTVDFDSTADYSMTDIIMMQYYVTSATSDPITMHMTIDYDTFEFECQQGFNEYTFENLSPGIHKISFYVSSGIYKSSVVLFNIVVVNAEALYISTTFNGGQFEYGKPIPIDYRISKLGTEQFDVRLELDGSLVKTMSVPVGSYYWTLNDIPVGPHVFSIKVSSAYGEYMELNGEFIVIEGDYTPLKITEAGLLYRLNARGRTNNDSDRTNPVDNSGNGIKTTLHNFNYFSNGWIDNALVCDGLSYVEIDAFPWSDNAIYGSTIEIQFKGLDIGMFGARIFDYTDTETPYKGAYIDLEETTMKSLANSGTINLDSDRWITISFVIDRKNKFGKIFVDGICSRAFMLSDTGSGTTAMREDFSHSQKIFLNSRKGEDKFGACEIRDIRIYGRVLSDDEIVQNVIAQIDDLAEQKKQYDFNYNNTSLPTIKMYGDTTNMTLETPVTMRIKYTSTNEDKYGQSFDLPYCQVNWQGTSSLQYVLKNFTARLKDENMADYYYTPYPNGVPETTFCFKADYMESSHSRNVGLAKFVNACLYDEKNPAQLKNSNIRNTVDGFPVLLYINDEFQGVYNFNLDRYSTKSFGYTSDTTLVYEVSANSDTTAGAFYKWSQSSGKSQLDYYKSDFECVYPPTRSAGNDDMAELIRLVEWVNDSSDEDFKDNINKYFNLQYLLRYFLYVYVVGAVDSLGKNMKLTSWDGLIWYPQVYDADTTIGLDNTGFLKFDMDIEMGDKGVFNTTGSQLWKRVQLLFKAELEAQYALMRQKYFTEENMMKYILEEQILKIPAIYYNKDMQTKYLDFGSSYLYALHGSSEHHIRKWLRERLIYCDTLFGYTVSTADYITIRSSKIGYVYLDIQTYIPMYVRVKWRDEANNTGVQVKRVARGETVRFEYTMPTATDQEIFVYGGHYLKSLGDLTNLEPTSLLIANASRLTEITCHSPNLINTDLSVCTKLQRIDLSDSTVLGTGTGAQRTLNIQNCKYLRYCNCHNTQLTAIYTMQQGGNLEEIYFPKSTQIIQVTNQVYMKVLGIPYYCENLADVQITNCNDIQYIQYPYNEGDPLDFGVFKYVQNLSITNSLDKLTSMSFSGFTKLRNVTLNSLSKLAQLGFDDMLPTSEISTIQSVSIGDCPLVKSVTFNVSSDDYKVEFAQNGLIDISGLQSCETIESNYSIKGINKIILPLSIKNVYLSSTYGDGDNHLSNLWSVSAIHDKDDFAGIDFLNLDLENFRMDGCSRLTNAINFYLTPVNELPDLSAFESLQGWVNFDKYVGDIRYMFKGINFTFTDFEVIFNQTKEQTDITGLFQNAVINKEQFNRIISKFPNAIIYDYFLEGSTIEEDYEFPDNAISVVGAFKNCINMTTYHENWLTGFSTDVDSDECYTGCLLLPMEEIPASWGGYGLDIMSIYELQIPNDNYTIVISTPGSHLWSQTAGGKISWGDGSEPEIYDISGTAVTHTYSYAGTYYLRATFNPDSIRYATAAAKNILTKVVQETSELTNLESLYENCNRLSSIRLSSISPVNLKNAFRNTNSLDEISGIETWNMSKVVTLYGTFDGCGLSNYSFMETWSLPLCIDTTRCFANTNTNTNKIDISKWNIPNLNHSSQMFMGSKVATIDISNKKFDTMALVDSMLSNSNIKTVIANNIQWDDPATINDILTSAPINTLVMDTINSNVTDFTGLCKNCTALKNDIPLPLNTTSAIDTFNGCSSMTHVHDNWNNSYKIDVLDDIVWIVGSLIYNTPTNFGSLDSSWTGSGSRSTDFIELTTDIMIEIPDYSSNTKPNIRVLAYDADKTAIGNYEFDADTWYLVPGTGTNYKWSGEQLRIPIDDEGVVKYVRITLDAGNSSTVQSIVNETVIGLPMNSSNCYSGCSNIRYINGVEQTYSEYTKPIDGIPKHWGGFGYSPETTAIFAVETATDDYTFQSSFYPDDTFKLTMLKGAFVDWGDGTTEYIGRTHRGTPKHTYAKAGRYIVKGNLVLTRPGYGGHGPATQCVTEVYQYPTNKTIANQDPTSMMFYQFNKLRTAIVPNRIFDNKDRIFYGCTSLEYVDLTGSTFSGDIKNSFYDCKKLHTIKGLTSNSFTNVTNMTFFFRNCESIRDVEFFRNVDFSACTNFTGIMTNAVSVKDITPIWDNPTIKNVKVWNSAFQNVPAEGDVLDFSFMDRNGSYSFQYTFTGTKYKKVTGLSGLSLSGNVIGAFASMPLVEEIDLTDADMSKVSTLSTAWNAFIYDCPKLRVLKMDGVKVTDTLTNGYWGYFGMSCPKLETLSFKGSDLYIKDAYRIFETNDTATTLDASDLDLKNLSNASGWSAPFRWWSKLVDFYPPKNIMVNYEPAAGNNVLSAESLLRIIDNLVDVGETRTLTIGATLLAKLTPAQIAVANNKGWTIQ
jgi:hypothetical protein